MTLSVAALATTGALAADSLGMRQGKYGMGGCGLGSMLFEKNTKVHQVLAATTNGTFGTTTFGITSGTSNCTGGGVARADKEREMFVEANFETLTTEMAQGKGETLAAFGSLLGCTDSAKFGAFAQSNYAGTFSKASTPAELLGVVENELGTTCQL